MDTFYPGHLPISKTSPYGLPEYAIAGRYNSHQGGTSIGLIFTMQNKDKPVQHGVTSIVGQFNRPKSPTSLETTWAVSVPGHKFQTSQSTFKIQDFTLDK